MSNVKLPIDSDTVKELATKFHYAPFMIQRIMLNFEKEYLDVLRAFDRPPLDTLRVNTLKIEPASLHNRLEIKGLELMQEKWIDYAFRLVENKKGIPVGATHEYLQGHYYLQSLASMIPVHQLSPQPGDRVLDMCASPGSKTTQIAQLMKNQGTIVAVDIKESRMKALISNVKRCGITNCIAFPYDSTQIKSSILPAFKPNKILLDAPCSGSGIIRIDKSPKQTKDGKQIQRLAEIQKNLLRQGLQMLEAGGTLLYSTCSFHYEENEQVVASVLKKMKDVEIIEPYYPDIGLPGFQEIDGHKFGNEFFYTRRLYPNLHDTDAFFFALLHKKKPE